MPEEAPTNNDQGPEGLSSITPTISKTSKKLSASKLKSTTKIPVNIDALADKKEEGQQDTPSVTTEEAYGNEPFTIEALNKVWQEYAQKKKQQGKDSEHMVLKQEIYLKNDTTIIIKLTNAVKIDILDKFRSDLITYLKAQLNNSNISIETELIEEDAKRMIYTNKEKFAYLAKKKPILNQLRDRLGLDPDF